MEDFPEGGTTNLDVNDCATGYAVVVNGDTEAVFVTEAEDGNVDYVDTAISKDKETTNVHVKIGSSICFGDEYANGTYTWTPEGATQAIIKPLSNEGCLIVDASMEDVTVNVEKHVAKVEYAATIDSVKFDSEKGASFALTAHKYLDGVEDSSHTVHNVTADVTIYTEDGTPVQTNASVATGLDTSITVNTTCKLTAGQKYYAEITLTCNGQKYPTVTTDVFQAQPDAV